MTERSSGIFPGKSFGALREVKWVIGRGTLRGNRGEGGPLTPSVNKFQSIWKQAWGEVNILESIRSSVYVLKYSKKKVFRKILWRNLRDFGAFEGLRCDNLFVGGVGCYSGDDVCLLSEFSIEYSSREFSLLQMNLENAKPIFCYSKWYRFRRKENSNITFFLNTL